MEKIKTMKEAIAALGAGGIDISQFRALDAQLNPKAMAKVLVENAPGFARQLLNEKDIEEKAARNKVAGVIINGFFGKMASLKDGTKVHNDMKLRILSELSGKLADDSITLKGVNWTVRGGDLCEALGVKSLNLQVKAGKLD